jgi:hypothetical protein
MTHGTSNTSTLHYARPGVQPRIQAMFRRDRGMAIGALTVLWLTLGFVYLAVPHGFLASPIGIVLSVAMVLLLLFNTTSVTAMLRHYREDRDHIYGLDIHHLDEHRARRRAEAAAVAGTPQPRAMEGA